MNLTNLCWDDFENFSNLFSKFSFGKNIRVPLSNIRVPLKSGFLSYLIHPPPTPTHQIWSLEHSKQSLGPSLVVFHRSASLHTTTSAFLKPIVVVEQELLLILPSFDLYCAIYLIEQCNQSDTSKYHLDIYVSYIYTHMRRNKGHESPSTPYIHHTMQAITTHYTHCNE